MEFRDVLSRRRMVRHYRREPIPRETLERIAETVRRARSARFTQAHRLLVIDDPDVLGASSADRGRDARAMV